MGRGGHGIDPVIRVLEGAELTFQQDGLSRGDSLLQVLVHISDVGADHFPPLHELCKQNVGIQGVLVIQMYEQSVFQRADIL